MAVETKDNMILGVLKEGSSEKRVAVTPDTIAAIQKLGIEKIIVEQGAGSSASYGDEAYKEKGATIASRSDVLKNANLIACIKGITHEEISSLGNGQMVMGQFNPLSEKGILEPLNANKVTAFSLDMLPRTTRAQAMDVLSSMATAAGYKAVLAAANQLPSFFPDVHDRSRDYQTCQSADYWRWGSRVASHCNSPSLGRNGGSIRCADSSKRRGVEPRC